MSSKNPPNIVIITIDALRRDAFSTWSNKLHTPLYMDTFAERAVVFNNHYAVATSTLMNLYSMYTGLHPRQQPIRDLKTASIPINQVPSLGDFLQSSGYTMWSNMQEYSGDPKLFPLSKQGRNYRNEPIYRHFSSTKFPKTFPDIPEYYLYGIAEASLPFALEHYRKNNSKAFIHLWLQDLHVLHRHPGFYTAAGLTEPKQRTNFENPIVSRYYDIVYHIDAYIEEFLSEVYKINDNVLVIINTDHGEALGEYPVEINDAKWFANDGRQYDHGYPNQIENNLIHTPCIVKPPQWNTGLKINQLVSVNDLFHTICSYLPSAQKCKNKYSWRHLLEGNKPHQHRFVIADTRWWTEHDRASALITENNLKLIQYSNRTFKLFDLNTDPDESIDMFGKKSLDNQNLLQRYTQIESITYNYLKNKQTWTLENTN